MSRIFDTLPTATQKDILKSALAFSKAEIAEESLTDDPVEYAVGFGEMFFLEEEDFSILTAIEINAVTGWVGGRPPHRPKTW